MSEGPFERPPFEAVEAAVLDVQLNSLATLLGPATERHAAGTQLGKAARTAYGAGCRSHSAKPLSISQCKELAE